MNEFTQQDLKYFAFLRHFFIGFVYPLTAIALIPVTIAAALAGRRTISRAARGMKTLQRSLDAFAGLNISHSIFGFVLASTLVFGRGNLVASLGYGAAAQAVMGSLFMAFLCHLLTGGLASLALLVPSTRIHPELARASTLLVVAIGVPITIVIYFPAVWWPQPLLERYTEVFAPPMACLLLAAVWFAIKAGAAAIHGKHIRAHFIAAFLLFHVTMIGLYVFLVFVLVQRMAAGEGLQ